MTFYIEPLVNLYQNTFEWSTTFPDWLTLAKTILLPKNEHTHAVKSYQPIACLNLTYKLYTSCLNNFLEHHCQMNSMGNYGTITNQQKHPKRSKNPGKKKTYRMARLPKSLWFNHTWVVIAFIEISQSKTTTFISNWKPYKTLGYYCIVTWHRWIRNYWHS